VPTHILFFTNNAYQGHKKVVGKETMDIALDKGIGRWI
jgi:hypothetical protein